MAARGLAIPYMIREGLIAERFFAGNDGDRAALRRNYLAARTVIAQSRENLDFLRSRLDLPADFGRVIANSAADAFFAPCNQAARAARRRQLGLSETDILRFTAAGLRPIKGYAVQIQAMRHLERRSPSHRIRFAWAGGGPMRDFLDRQIARFGFAGHIHLLGHVADAAEWLDAADMFILPSLGEGMPGSVLEAMAKGVPVIATPAGGTPEALGDCGHLLPETEDENGRASALAEAILNWADDDNARRRAGERGRARARAHFTRAPMLKAYMESIEQLFAAL